jgi:sugar lactone lactonase YvrE
MRPQTLLPVSVLIGALCFGVPQSALADILYVPGWLSGEIVRLDSSANRTVFATTPARGPFGLAFDRDGNLFVSNNADNNIRKFTPAGVESTFANTGPIGPPNFNAPLGMAFDRNGNLYVAVGNSVMKYGPNGVGSVFANVPTWALAFDTAGNLFTANDHSVQKITPAGVVSTFATFTTPGLSQPLGLAFDSSGNLFVSNIQTSTITKFAPDGTGSLFAGSVSGALGLAFDSAGNLFVGIDFGGGMLKIAPNGTQTSVAFGDAPRYFAFTDDAGHPLLAVPEPASLALLLFGLPALFVARRLRRC